MNKPDHILRFTKLSACGNDFVALDNRSGAFSGEEQDLLRYLCDRRLCAGADGVLFVEGARHAEDDFHMRIFNPDGSEAWMCGNGARACAHFARQLGLGGETLHFSTRAGRQEVRICGNESSLKLSDPVCNTPLLPPDLSRDTETLGALKSSPVGFARVGVPHLVCLCQDDIWEHPIDVEGKTLRYHAAFAPEGTNVMFVELVSAGELNLRSWEKGVEDETWGCGTGSVAACLLLSKTRTLESEVIVHMKGGDLRVSQSDGAWSFTGEIHTAYEGVAKLPAELSRPRDA